MKKLLLILIFLNTVYGERFKISIPQYKIEDNQLIIDNFGYITETNRPRLPAKSIFILLPKNSKIKNWKTIVAQREILPDTYSIEYTKNKLLEDENYFDTAITSYVPDSIIKFIGIENLLNYTVARFMVCPFIYDKEEKILAFYPTITIDIDYTKGSITAPSNESFDSLIEIINFDDKSKWYYKDTGYDYIIVADKKFENILKDFIYWKESIGYKVKVVNNKEELTGSPKYILVIGDSIKNSTAIVGEIPYNDTNIVSNILERTIEFELNEDKNSILFVKGITNYKNENNYEIPKEDKIALLNKLKSIVRENFWRYEEQDGKEIFTDYSIINFLSCGKEWLWDDGDGIPEKDEIKISKFTIHNDMPYIVFVPYIDGDYKLLKDGAVCVIAPKFSSHYICGWQDTLEGGSQTFNYTLLKYLVKKKIVGDAVFLANIYQKTYFPQDINEFKIYGDPSISLEPIYNSDIGIVGAKNDYILPDTEFCPSCSIKNFGNFSQQNLMVVCQIISDEGVVVYRASKTIEKINSQEEIEVQFDCWADYNYKFGIDYNIKFEIISTKDKNKENDTLSTITKVMGGDFLVIGKDTIITNILTGYKGMQTDSLTDFMKNFKTIFILQDIEGIDSLPQNLYVEGNNLWLSKFIEGDIIEERSEARVLRIEGLGLSFSCSTMYMGKWFLPKNYTTTFIDTVGDVVSFFYQNDKYKIWSSKFNLKDVPSDIRVAIIDSVIQFFGLKKLKEYNKSEKKQYNIFLECSPNPLYDKTLIKFKIKKSSDINLSIYNITGKLIKKLYDEFTEPGEYEIVWDCKDDTDNEVLPGVYFLKLKSKEETKLIKLIVFK